MARSRHPWRWTVHTLWAIAVVAAFALSWFAASRAGGDTIAPNPTPVVVLMDSPLPGRVYDERTAAAGGTNADGVTDAIRALPVVIQKENTSAVWHREEQVLAQQPDLIVAHLSCLFDARVTADLPSAHDHLFAQAENRLLLFFAYAAARNPRTRFIIYSRTVFQGAGGERQWVAQLEARLPVLKGKVQAFIVPGGREATFRDPETARLLRARIVALLGLPSEDGKARVKDALHPSVRTRQYDAAPGRSPLRPSSELARLLKTSRGPGRLRPVHREAVRRRGDVRMVDRERPDLADAKIPSRSIEERHM
jgi:hypothetical protein